MSKSKKSFILVLLLVSIVLLPTVHAFSGSGAGSAEDPYLITNCTQVQEMSDALTSSYQLSNSIDCSDTINWNSGAGFAPVGDSSTKFTGNFNGSGYTISDLFISRTSTDYIGLFGYIDTSSDIRDVGLVNVNITGSRYVGSLVGYTKSSVYNSYVSGNVQCSSYNCGGLIGQIYAAVTINNSYSTANVTGSSSTVGGLISYAYTSSGSVVIDNCYATGYIQCDGFCGGLLGSGTNIIINNSYATGDVYSTGLPTGGLAGYPGGGIIENTYATGNVNSTASRVGGLLGSFSGTMTIRNCYSTGNAITTGQNAGGFAGDSEGTGTISDCYSTGNATGSFYVGGFIGEIVYSTTITDSYSTGYVTASSNKGGFNGYMNSGSCTATYWDTETSGQATSASCGTGKTTTEMTNVSTYTTTNPWDFQGNPGSDTADNDYWGISENLNDGYPLLVGLGVGEGMVNPIVSLNNPDDNQFIAETTATTFNCSISGANTMSNISLYITDDSNSSFALNQTQTLSGSSGSGQWDVSLGAGDYTWNCFGQDNQNLTDWGVNRSIMLDNEAPAFTVFANQTALEGNALSYDIDATDALSGVDCFSINDTTNFAIDCDGLLTNATTLAIGTYWLNVTVNDSLSQETSAEMSVEMTPIPNIGLTLTSPIADINATQNVSFTVSATVSCSNANCGEVNVSLDPEDRTVRTCSEMWGESCAGADPNIANYSFGCSAGSYYSSGFWVDEVFVDATSVSVGDEVTITCDYDCYSTSSLNDLAISYYNGSWHQLWAQNDSCTDGNYSIAVNISGEEGEHRARCQIGYNSNNPSGTCFTTTYSDNDDVNFTVTGAKSGLVSTDSSETPFYTTTQNPYTISLNEDESAVINWTVNATGDYNTTHEFYAYANLTSDGTVNNETSHINITIVDFVVGTQAPSIAITYPSSGDVTTDVTDLNYTVSTDQILDVCWYSLDDGATNSSTVSAGVNFTGLSSDAGANTWAVYCNDNNTLIGGGSVVFNRIPLIGVTVNSPSGDANVTQNETFSVSATVSCSNVDCGEINVSLDPNLADDSDKYAVSEESQYALTSAITLYDNKSFDYDIQDGCDLNDGESDVFDAGLRLYINASEYTGTRSTTEDDGREATCDVQTKSNLGVSRKVYVPSDQNWARYLDILNNTGADEVCVVVRIYQNMGSDGSDFMNTSDYDSTWELTDHWMMWDDASPTTSDDAATFIYQHDDADEKIDSFIPTTASGGYNEWTWSDVCVSAGETKILMYFFTQWDTREQSETEADYIYTNIAEDLYSTGMSDAEKSQVSNLVLASEKSGLISTVVGTEPFYTTTDNPYLVNLSAGESEIITWTVNATGTYNTTHEFYIYANQSANESINIETTHWNITILNETTDTSDITAPVVTINSPTNNSVSSDTDLDVTFTVTETAPDSCWYSVNSMTTNTTLSACANITSATWTDTKHNITIWANDTSGNNGSSSLSFTIDTTNPVVTINYPSNRTNSSDVNLDINYTITDENIDACWYSNDTSAENITVSSCSNLTDVTWSESQYNITIWSNDSVGNVASNSLIFNLDTSPPTITLDYPSNLTNSSDSGVDINYTVSDPRLDSCWYNNGTSENITVSGCANLTDVTWPDGQYNVTVWVNDTLANKNNTAVIFTIDSTAPTISINSPSNNTYTTNTVLDVNYTIDDDNIASCWYSNDTMGANTTLVSCANITSVTWAEGPHNVTVWVNDTFGSEDEATTNFTIDTTNPTWEDNRTDLTNTTLQNTEVYFNITLNDTNPDKYIFEWYNGSTWVNDTEVSYTNGQELNVLKNTTIYYGDINWSWHFNDTVGNSNQTDVWGISINSTDTDDDGIIDEIDPLFYNETNVTNDGITTLNISIGGNLTNTSVSDVQEVVFYDEDEPIINFTHNFTEAVLDLSNVTINKSDTYLVVNITDQLLGNKTLYLTDNSFIALCVKDEPVGSVDEISSGCDGTNETDFTTCLGSTAEINGINCTDDGTTLRIDNLQHSAIRGTQASTTSTSSGSSPAQSPPRNVTTEETTGCNTTADCDSDETCHENSCVKLFDIKILDISDPEDGEISFDYFVKGMANISDDIIIKFWLELDGESISSGQDTIYIGSFEEKEETAKLFITKELAEDNYELHIEVTYGDYSAESYRTFVVEDGEVEVETFAPATERLQFNFFWILIPSAVVLLIVILLFLRSQSTKKEHQRAQVLKHNQQILIDKQQTYQQYINLYNRYKYLVAQGQGNTQEAQQVYAAGNAARQRYIYLTQIKPK